MDLRMKDVLPLLETILRQQSEISQRLAELIATFKHEPEPVEPTLRALLKPVSEGISEMKKTLVPKGSSAASST